MIDSLPLGVEGRCADLSSACGRGKNAAKARETCFSEAKQVFYGQDDRYVAVPWMAKSDDPALLINN